MLQRALGEGANPVRTGKLKGTDGARSAAPLSFLIRHLDLYPSNDEPVVQPVALHAREVDLRTRTQAHLLYGGFTRGEGLPPVIRG